MIGNQKYILSKQPILKKKCDQKMPQSHITDELLALWKRCTRKQTKIQTYRGYLLF